jgi:hypothetical protein
MNAVAPPIGALLLSALSIREVPLVDVLTVQIAVLQLCLIRIPSPSTESVAAATKRSVWEDMRDGFHPVWGRPGLIPILVMASLLSLLTIPCLSFVPLLVTSHVRMGPLGLG